MTGAWITIVGRLGRDAELRYLPDGTPVCAFSAAVEVPVRQGDRWVDGDPMWFDVSFFGDRAETIVQRLKKGSTVTVIGQFKTRTYTGKDGQVKTALDVRAFSVAAGSGDSSQGGQQEQRQRQQRGGRRQDADDLPFE